MTSWRRPSNRSSRVASPSGPSKRYSFSTAIHGIRRRSAASASPALVCSFSFTSSFSRAAFHSCGETIGGVFISSLLESSNGFCWSRHQPPPEWNANGAGSRAEEHVHLSEGLLLPLARPRAQPLLQVLAGLELRTHLHPRAAAALAEPDPDPVDRHVRDRR